MMYLNGCVQVIFRQTKTFYEEASKLQYFKYLVSVPTLPAVSLASWSTND